MLLWSMDAYGIYIYINILFYVKALILGCRCCRLSVSLWSACVFLNSWWACLGSQIYWMEMSGLFFVTTLATVYVLWFNLSTLLSSGQMHRYDAYHCGEHHPTGMDGGAEELFIASWQSMQLVECTKHDPCTFDDQWPLSIWMKRRTLFTKGSPELL